MRSLACELEGLMAFCEREYYRHRFAVLFVIIFSVFVLGSIGCKRTRSFQGYDGTWWEYVPLEQRLGFIDGFVDFYTFGCRKEGSLCQERNKFADAITSYYANHLEDESMTVGAVLIRVAKASGATSFEGWNPPASEEETGAFDGRAWAKYSTKERLGFVEGYLNALMPQSSRAANYPRSSEYYAKAVTRFYSMPVINASQPDVREYPLNRQIGKILWDMRSQRQ
jgi:hypothetical protein